MPIYRQVSLLLANRGARTNTYVGEASQGAQISWALDIMLGKSLPTNFLEDQAHALDARTSERLVWWRENTAKDRIQRLAESNDERDQHIWQFVMPAFIRAGLDHQPPVISSFRESVSSAVLRFHPLITTIAGISGKGGPVTQAVRSPALGGPRSYGIKEPPKDRSFAEHKKIIAQWQIWLAMLCATAVIDSRAPFVREHTRAVSELQSQRERLATPRGLFRLVIPFLASDHTVFRKAAVNALGCIHQSAFKALLEDLQSITRHIYDDTRNNVPPSRGGVSRGRPQDRLLHTAVAQVYQLTAHFTKDPRSIDAQISLKLLLAFVRETTLFLRNPAVRDDWELQQLRRFFCGVVENLFDGLATLPRVESDRWLSPNQRLSLYRLCEEWCTYGAVSESSKVRLQTMAAQVPLGRTDARERSDLIQNFNIETLHLSGAAAGAMASLCVSICEAIRNSS